MVLSYACFLVAALISTTAAVSRLRDKGTCFRQYTPPQPGFPHARCRLPMGGNPAQARVFIRNAFTCCRRRQASGWGSESNCQSCSSVREVLSPWSQCSKTCGWGEQKRVRQCNNNVCADGRGRRKTETRACMWKACCPVDGNWADWTAWSDCSATCGDGFQYRTRSCSSPSPSCGGKPCKSYPRQMQLCRAGQCASWSSWASVGSCSVTCGLGTIKRTRSCYMEGSQTDQCVGEAVQYSQCDAGSCAVDGEWCEWDIWSSCTTSCQHSYGTQKRSRSCECPVPSQGGKECAGSDGEVTFCSSKVICPIDGGWDDWSSWTSCSSERCSKSPGMRRRTRLCNNPPPLYGGTCEGPDAEEGKCVNLVGCHVEGHYGEWSSWSPCTLSCGTCREKIRVRECYHSFKAPDTERIGNPEYYCVEEKKMDTTHCNPEMCPDGSDPCVGTSTDVDYYGDEYETEDGESEWEYHDHYDGRDEEIEDIFREGYESGDDHAHDYDGGEEDDYVNGHGQYGDSETSEGDDLSPEIMRNIFGIESTVGSFNEPDITERTGDLNYDEGHDHYDDSEDLMKGLVDPHDDVGSGDEMGDTAEDSLPYRLPEPDFANSGYEPSKKEIVQPKRDVAGCDELRNAKGENASAANGCCEILSGGLNNATDPKRFEECFSLHYDLAIHTADDMTLAGKTSRRGRCIYRASERLLQTICCLLKDCNSWQKKDLRNQCIRCRYRRACQSCHNILLNG